MYSTLQTLNFHCKKGILTIFILSGLYFSTSAQVSINTTNANPHPSSMLDVSSANKGLLIPRMSMTEMAAIPAPAEGLLVYVNSGASGLYQYRSGNWEKLFAFNGSLLNGGVLFGANASFAQNNNHFFWNDAQKYLGIGTNTPNAPLTVSSLLPPTGNGGGNTWIVSNIGAQSGSRFVAGTREGQATIGATNFNMLAWDTLNINPGGKVRLGNYTSATGLLIGTDPTGLIRDINVQNGLNTLNGALKLGGTLAENTEINLNAKNINLRSGGLAQTTVDAFAPTGSLSSTTTFIAQSFKTTYNGVLNAIRIRAFHYIASALAYYEIVEGEGPGGNIIASGNFTIPHFNGPSEEAPVVVIPLNLNVGANLTYTIKLNYNDNLAVTLITLEDVYPNGHFYSSYYSYPTFDLRFQLVETETPYDLVVFAPNKKVNIGGDGQAVLNVNSFSSSGNWFAASFGADTGGDKLVLGHYQGNATIGAVNAAFTLWDTLSLNPMGAVRIPNLAGTGTRAMTIAPDGTLQAGSGLVSNITVSAPLTITNPSSTPHIAISQASGSQNGFLSSLDWNTFNNKQNALPNASASNSGILTSTDWNNFNNKQNALPNASASNSGILTSTDWTSFNNKFNLPPLNTGSLLFSDGTTIAQNNANLFWNNTTQALGIGTSSPVAGLHINGYQWNDGLRITNNEAGTVGPAVFLDGARDFAIISTGSAAGAGAEKLGFYDATANQYRMVLNNSGNVGVGELNPNNRLVVNGTGGLKVSSAHPGSGYSDWVAANIGGIGDQRVVIGQFDNIAAIGAHNADLNAWRDLAINPNATGNVGIGTTTPSYKLDVNGSQRVTGNLTVTGHVRQNVQQISISVPGAVYPVINPFTGGNTTPTFGEATAIWVHNLGYNPVVMTSLDFTSGGHLHHVNISYRHADNNTIEFYFSNQSVNTATGILNIIVVN
jgi:hypothetical protein